MAATGPIIRFFLLRGLAREVRHWGKFIPLLAQAASNYRVIPLEIPGAGSLCNRRAPGNIDGYVQAVRSQFQQSFERQDINIAVGISFGGMIAACWAAVHPKDFQAVVLINTSSKESPPLQRILPGGAAQLLTVVLTPGSYGKEKRIADLICNLADTNDIATEWASIREQAPVSFINVLNQLYSAAHFSFPPLLQKPVLLLCSKKDRLVSFKCTEKIAARLECNILYHDRAGHDLTTDDPHWCVSTIQQWLSQRDRENYNQEGDAAC